MIDIFLNENLNTHRKCPINGRSQRAIRTLAEMVMCVQQDSAWAHDYYRGGYVGNLKYAVFNSLGSGAKGQAGM